MGIFDKLREPVVLKDNSDAIKQIEQLNNYLNTAPEDIKPQIQQDIRLLQYGIRGEEALMFELKNSHLPMYIMHDLFFELNGLKAQIDFLIVTRKLVIILECKNLFGNINIDNQGNFTRTVQLGNRFKKTGIYSPIAQNERHIKMIREIRRESKSVIFRKAFEKYFDDIYKSIVVLANPSSVLEMRYAPKEIKDKIVRLDGLTRYIEKLHEQSDLHNRSDKEMKELADFYCEKSVQNTKDYTEKYRIGITDDDIQFEKTQENEISDNNSIGTEKTPLYEALRSYRYNKNRDEGVKPYYLFNNSQLDALISADPHSINDIKKVSGFGEIKCSKYGEDILSIFEEYRKKA